MFVSGICVLFRTSGSHGGIVLLHRCTDRCEADRFLEYLPILVKVVLCVVAPVRAMGP